MGARQRVRSAVAVASACLVLFGVQVASPAQAVPTPSPSPTPSPTSSTAAKLADAKKKVQELEKQSSAIEEDYEEAEQTLNDAKDRLSVLQDDIEAQQAKVDELAEQVRAIVLIQFRNRDVDPAVQIFTSGDPSTLLDRLSTADKVDQDMKATLAEHQAEEANLADLKRAEAAEVDALADGAARTVEFFGALS